VVLFSIRLSKLLSCSLQRAQLLFDFVAGWLGWSALAVVQVLLGGLLSESANP
jgi:hypothetical protein